MAHRIAQRHRSFAPYTATVEAPHRIAATAATHARHPLHVVALGARDDVLSNVFVARDLRAVVVSVVVKVCDVLTLNHIVAEFLSIGRRTTSMVVTVEQPDGTVLPELVQWLPSAARDEPIGTIGAAAIASSGSRPRMNGHVITRGSCMWRSAGASTSHRRTGPANTQFPAPRDPLRCPKLLNHKSRVHYTGSRPTPMSSTNEPAITLCDICRQGIVEVPHVGWLHYRPTRHDHEARPLAWLWRLQQ